MTRAARSRPADPVALARQLLASLGHATPEPANDGERAIDDATLEEMATRAAERMRRARKR